MQLIQPLAFGAGFLGVHVLALTLSNTPPVCIIGAGPGGLTIAHELETKGYSTVLFEKQPTVGGKCQSFYDRPDGTLYHPMGALIFTNQTWINTLPIIEASGLPLSPGPNVTSGFIYGAGIAANLVVPTPPVTDAQKALLASELQRYAAFWTANFAPKYTALRYTNGVPEEFSVPMAKWLQSQGFKALPQVMELGMVPFGYGDIKQTPAIYALQYFTPDVLGAFLGVVPSYNVERLINPRLSALGSTMPFRTTDQPFKDGILSGPVALLPLTPGGDNFFENTINPQIGIEHILSGKHPR
ncbi:hypothetical protein BDY19DRAFT_907329 [Irpex rosettiformis]|uniref:Uncharacterized protein n=1 Tax=Irpex rosettiformis TaxID=378272 RepID=A0ACB8TZE3_9APHY|nr:hypothetical protein BDY19DRAFT_907329 [Irpex rosettiformis]